MPDSTETFVAQTSTGNGVNLDLNHPYFLHSYDVPGMRLVNIIYDRRGFQGWKRFILIALSAKNKVGFINGTFASPPITFKDYQPWSRCNDMVTSWLLNSLSKDIGDSVIYSNSARELWISLEHRFGQSNGAKLYYCVSLICLILLLWLLLLSLLPSFMQTTDPFFQILPFIDISLEN